jgi:CheY-like chemotaxis protein
MNPAAKLRCVVIDDDREFLAKLHRWFFSSCPDVEVLPFAHALDAIEFLRRERVDAIFTAYLMPQIDGLQLIGILRGFDAQVPIFMISEVPLGDAAIARGANAFLPKTQLWAELDTVVSELRESVAPLAA